jgi:hypothetical protein
VNDPLKTSLERSRVVHRSAVEDAMRPAEHGIPHAKSLDPAMTGRPAGQAIRPLAARPLGVSVLIGRYPAIIGP